MSRFFRAATLTNFPETVRHLGGNPVILLREAGLSLAQLEDPEQRISAEVVVALLENAARITNCPTFGLRMAESRQLSDLGLVSLLLSHQRTLRDLLRTTTEYRHLLNESIALHIEEAGKTVILREEVVMDSLIRPRQAIELAIGVLFRTCAAFLGAHWQPYSVHFTHTAPPDLKLHWRVFDGKHGCRVEFDSEFNGIVCSAADLDYPNPMADPAMARYARRFLETLPGATEPSIVHEVRKAIYLLLPMGRATAEQVAQGFGFSLRTLQRQLDDAGESFTGLLNGVRRDLAISYMENRSNSLAHVAELLGYNMPSSFTRWFAAQFAVAPAEWRKTRAQLNDGP
jgi:AraC-like DNA-binding protein